MSAKIANIEIKRADYLKKHQQFFHIGTKFNCKECDYKANGHHDLKKHIEIVHKLPCPNCEYKTSRTKDLNKHIKYFHESKICEICNQNFKFISSLRLHKKAIHMVKRDFSCQACLKQFVSKGVLNVHVRRTHKNSTFFECEQCGFKTNTKTKLKHHTKFKHDNETFSCDMCSQELSSKGALNSHIKSVQTKYPCLQCGHQASSNGNLKC